LDVNVTNAIELADLVSKNMSVFGVVSGLLWTPASYVWRHSFHFIANMSCTLACTIVHDYL